MNVEQKLTCSLDDLIKREGTDIRGRGGRGRGSQRGRRQLKNVTASRSGVGESGTTGYFARRRNRGRGNRFGVVYGPGGRPIAINSNDNVNNGTFLHNRKNRRQRNWGKNINQLQGNSVPLKIRRASARFVSGRSRPINKRMRQVSSVLVDTSAPAAQLLNLQKKVRVRGRRQRMSMMMMNRGPLTSLGRRVASSAYRFSESIPTSAAPFEQSFGMNARTAQFAGARRPQQQRYRLNMNNNVQKPRLQDIKITASLDAVPDPLQAQREVVVDVRNTPNPSWNLPNIGRRTNLGARFS